MTQPSRPGQPNRSVEQSSTLIETEEEIREAILAGLKGQQQAVPVDRPVAPPPPIAQPPGQAPQSIPTAHPPALPAANAASLYRPTSRPPLAILTVFDDGKSDGELIRIRAPKFTIGRTEGDLRIPIDGHISSRHVEITLQVLGGVHRWVVTDLQSTHGMFVRVSRTVLNDRAEFLVGNGRYRFETPHALADQTTSEMPDDGGFGQTRGWADGPSPFRAPALTELLGNEIGSRTLLVKAEYWIGTDPGCPICRPDDPFCEPRHVRLFRGRNGGWHAEHNKTVNGLWIRMPQIVVDPMVRFQIGEQRFQIKVV
ncbi:MAG: FHA domain-containing protein [Isosphaeraceae bacterium]